MRDKHDDGSVDEEARRARAAEWVAKKRRTPREDLQRFREGWFLHSVRRPTLPASPGRNRPGPPDEEG